MNSYSLNSEFLLQYDRNCNYVLHSVASFTNKKIFIQRCYDIVAEANRYEDIKLTRMLVLKYIKIAKQKTNGWFSYEKDMSLLAYNTALDVLDSLIKKEGL